MKPQQPDVIVAFDVAQLFRARHLELVRLATMLLGDQAAGEDVVQDVYARICARRDGFPADQLTVSYFRTAVVNGCRSVHRRRAVAVRFGRSVPAPFWDEPQPSAESAALLAEDRCRVLRALAALPRRQREALVLRYYQRLTEPEIAEAMGISRGTVKSTLHRGLAALGSRFALEDRR